MTYEQIFKVLYLYEGQYRHWINDDGTIADIARCAELIHAVMEDEDKVDEKHLDTLAEEYLDNLSCERYYPEDLVEAYKDGYKDAKADK